eukprot:gene7744-biopygen12082
MVPVEPERRRRTPEDPRHPRERGFAGAGRAGSIPAPLWKDRTPIFPKRCRNGSGTPRTATDQRRRNRAPGDPGDPRGPGGAVQAPKVPGGHWEAGPAGGGHPRGFRDHRERGFAGAGLSVFIWQGGHGPATHLLDSSGNRSLRICAEDHALPGPRGGCPPPRGRGLPPVAN